MEPSSTTMILPKHIGIIMDGNGRWAKQRGKLRILGHRAGLNAVRKTVTFAAETGLEVITLFAFSSENWKRSVDEVSGLMKLFIYALKTEAKKLVENNIKLQVIGDISHFNKKLRTLINHVETLTKDNNGLVLNIAANYGGRWDIVNAVNTLIKMKNETTKCSSVTEEEISRFTCLSNVSELDLIIRTGGECRLSNFLLWQAAYAEFYFTDVLWPDFDEASFQAALDEFSGRERRFGSTSAM